VSEGPVSSESSGRSQKCDSLVEAAGIELGSVLKTHKLLIYKDDKNGKNGTMSE
jgi:hypothetical protein